MVFVGDVSVNDEARKAAERKGSKALFRYFRDFTSDADVIFGNLEAPLSGRGKPLPRKILLSATEEVTEGLRWAGFNVLNLANNHQFDFGPENFERTVELLKHNKIDYVGAGRDQEDAARWVQIERKEMKFAFLGYVDTKTGCVVAHQVKAGCNRLYLPKIFKDIDSAKKSVDKVIVSLHWGFEQYYYPSIQQRKVARAIIDHGADLIMGHHPHVIQGMEWYRGRPIFYSLGNFIFAQPRRYDGIPMEWTEDNVESIVPIVAFSPDKVEVVDVVPFRVDSKYRAVPLRGREKNECSKSLSKGRICCSMNDTGFSGSDSG